MLKVLPKTEVEMLRTALTIEQGRVRGLEVALKGLKSQKRELLKEIDQLKRLNAITPIITTPSTLTEDEWEDEALSLAFEASREYDEQLGHEWDAANDGSLGYE